MSVINNNIRRLDTQLDRLKPSLKDLCLVSLESCEYAERAKVFTENITVLENIIDSLSITSKSQPVLLVDQIKANISKFPHALLETHASSDALTTHSSNLAWLAVGKILVQTLGLMLKTLLDQTLAINDEILYWDEILSSRLYTGLYAVQTSPTYLWRNSLTAFSTSHNRDALASLSASVSFGWTKFYDLIQRCINLQNQSSLRTTVFAPLVASKSEVIQKRQTLKRLSNFNACAIGLLIEECFSNNIDDANSSRTSHNLMDGHWCSMVSRNVALIEGILQSAQNKESAASFGEELIAAVDKSTSTNIQPDSGYSAQSPRHIVERLKYILEQLLPNHITHSTTTITGHGRPSRLVRYWLPLSVALVSASTSLKLLKSRRHQLISWINNIGSTTIEFWSNWVVDPIQRLIGTIRHDEKSEIALMSRNSLEADRASLERMVVDFVLDRGDLKNDTSIIDNTSITDKVREGDLTPVLRAYEKDLRSPFVGTIRGDLVRALLIQIQKTKVDVEIAIGGIDALLKSQELVFGFVGLTPGIMVSYASLRWFCGLFGSRKGLRMGRRQDELRHALRNVHRTLTLSGTTNGSLTHQDHGHLICSTEILLKKAEMILKGVDLRTFQEDINDLINQKGLDRQMNVVGRIGWVYARWIQ